MTFDFSQLGTTRPSDTLTDPQEIFNALPGKAGKYAYLRDVQGEVLSGWYEGRTERDLVLKMNTGGGKTVVGLLALKSCLNEGVGPAAYFTPDNYLVSQVVVEARNLGIDVTSDPTSTDFLRGRAILVTSIAKLINGKSVFGVGQRGATIPLGSLLIDDAHACLAATEGSFTLKLPSSHSAYKALYALLRDDLHRQYPVALLDLEANRPTHDVLVPFTAWQSRIDQVRALLHQHAESDELKFIWPLLADDLALGQATFGRQGFQIEMRCLPVDRIPSFALAQRRIFMTATLPDDSLLITDFDVIPAALGRPVTPQRASDLGERMILAPQDLNPELNDTDIKALLVDLAATQNVVVIVPSAARAKFWADVAVQTLDRQSLEAGVSRLRQGHVGLTVLVNRYDGVDLPEAACRVLVIDGLPATVSQLEAVDASALKGSGAFLNRQIQRIEQGMGRGVRSSQDYCVVLLMGSSLIRQLYATGAKERFTMATRAQLALGDRLEQMLRRKGAEAMLGAIQSALAREPGWVEQAKAALAGVTYGTPAPPSQVAVQQRQALTLARRGDYAGAANALQTVVAAMSDPTARGWLKQQMAEYTNFFDQVKAQQQLMSGVQDNELILKPLAGVVGRQLPTFTQTQGERVLEHLRLNYSRRNQGLVDVNGLLEQLQFIPDTAPEFEAALQDLAPLLGFVSSRPEQQTGRGPDVLWSLGNGQFLVIEAKNGAVNQQISKSDCDQLSGSVNWFHLEYAGSHQVMPLIIHPSARFGYEAAPHPDARVMTREKLSAFREAVRQFMVALTASTELNAAQVGHLLVQYHLSAATLLQQYSVAAQVTKLGSN